MMEFGLLMGRTGVGKAAFSKQLVTCALIASLSSFVSLVPVWRILKN